MFPALAEFEADANHLRTAESYKTSVTAGRKWGRASPFHDPASVCMAKALLAAPRVARAEICRRLGLTKTTLYRWFPGGEPETDTGTPHGSAA